jgi:hypothetical protein
MLTWCASPLQQVRYYGKLCPENNFNFWIGMFIPSVSEAATWGAIFASPFFIACIFIALQKDGIEARSPGNGPSMARRVLLKRRVSVS